MRKKLICFSAAALFLCAASAQELKLDDNKFKLEKNTIAKVEKKKMGFLQSPEFHLVDAKDNILARAVTKFLKDSAGLSVASWHAVYFGASDSIELEYSQLVEEVGSKLFGGSMDETWAKLFFKKQIVNNDGTLNPGSVKSLQAKFSTNLSKTNLDKYNAMMLCRKSLANLPKRSREQAAVVNETGRTEVSAGTVRINYALEQGGTALGTVEATGSQEKAKDELAELEHMPGIVSLDREGALLSYEFKTNAGCVLATFNASEKTFTTEKDKLVHSFGKVAKNAKDIKTRKELIASMTAYLIEKGYL
jgi:hypothetical protein